MTLADVYERLKQNEQAIDAYDSVPDGTPLQSVLDALGDEQATWRTDDL